VLLGTYADGPNTFGRREVLDSILGLVRAHWGLGSKMLTDMMFPHSAPDDAVRYARMQRESASPEAAACFLDQMYAASVREILPDVRCPALILHYTEDRAIPFAGGRDLAAGLPDARLVPLSGAGHLPGRSDVDRIVEVIDEFLSD
jgi:pimeloyl-ACP methyl ester carboxylesterase